MQSKAATVDQYLSEVPPERQEAMNKLRKVISKNLPKGFKEGMGYGNMGYFVPHSVYPAGYHCNPKDPLPFAGIASQKNSINFYHMGIYADPKLLKWFMDEYAKTGLGKLDMGKSCMRFKKPENIPYKLIGELCSKITVEKWIEMYEKNFSAGKSGGKK
ncbi:MAG: DUF1801 domain-containing protein [Ferruginibacter sp.]